MQHLRICRRKFLRASLTASLASLAAMVAIAAADAADGFLSRLEDLPLVPGLAEDTSTGVSFDTAGGRIVEAFARGDLTRHQVLDFYRETLPQLGWTPESETEFRRGGERLRLELIQDAQGLIVHYSLSPQ